MKPLRMTPFVAVLALALCAFAAGLLPLATAAAQAPAPAARTFLNVPFRNVSTPGPTFDLVQSVIDFGPGAKSHTITIGTPHYLSVLEGELTVDVDGESEAVAVGKGVAAPAGAKLVLSNAGSSSARLFVSTLLAPGAQSDIHLLNAGGVKLFATARRTMTNAPATVDVIQMAASYDVGYRTANHVMNEFHLMIHTSGQVGYAYLDGASETYGPGSQAIMYEGRAGWMRNDGQITSSMVWTWVANPGKPLTSPVTAPAAPAPPNTGTGPGMDRSGAQASVAVGGLVLALLGAALAMRQIAAKGRPNR